MSDNAVNSNPGLLTRFQNSVLRALNPFNVLGRITTSEDGITLGSKRNALGRTTEGTIDSFTNFQGNIRGAILKTVLTSPSDFVTLNNNGVTIGPNKNGFAKFKDALVDLIK